MPESDARSVQQSVKTVAECEMKSVRPRSVWLWRGDLQGVDRIGLDLLCLALGVVAMQSQGRPTVSAGLHNGGSRSSSSSIQD